VNADEARFEAARILGAALDELTDAGRLSVFPPVRPEDWELPDGDRHALWSYGLPRAMDDDLMRVVGAFQEGRQPELEHEGSRLYLLGTFGATRLAATERTGVVLEMPSTWRSTQVFVTCTLPG
jgi:hypothetical protein